MYKGRSTWDREQERQQEKYDNIIGRDGDKPEYRNQGNYAASDTNPSDVYNTAKAGEERKKEEETGIEGDIKEEKKYKGKEESNEEDIKRKAASKVREAGKKEPLEEKKKKKEHKSIEDAINKAMKEEKDVIYMGD